MKRDGNIERDRDKDVEIEIKKGKIENRKSRKEGT